MEQIINQILKDSPQPEKMVCHKYPSEEALFYCDDCREFIGKTCFALHCRHCNCSTPELMVGNIKDEIRSLLKDLASLKKNVDENLDDISSLHTFFVGHKEEFKKVLDNTNGRLIKNLNIKAKEFSEEITHIFNGSDQDVDNSTQKLELNKKRAAKILNDFQDFSKEIENMRSDKSVCHFKKENDSSIQSDKKFLDEIHAFLNSTLEKTKKKAVDEMDDYTQRTEKFIKSTEDYEYAVTNTILSGIPNVCMRVRRFRKFYYQNTRYFKLSSIVMRIDQNINLAGFAFCGLFNHKSNRKTLDINVKLFECESMETINVNQTMISNIRVKIPLITNIIDPVYQVYLPNAVTVHKDKFYLITMTNMNHNSTGESPYVDIWTGEADKNEDVPRDITEHTVMCNNSNVKLTFNTSSGVESDLHEINGGILSDIIFSHMH